MDFRPLRHRYPFLIFLQAQDIMKKIIKFSRKHPWPLLILHFLEALVIRKSVSWLPEVEHGLSKPFRSDLRNLARAIDIPVSIPFGQAKPAPEEAGFVVQQSGRWPICCNETGLVERLLFSDLKDELEVVHPTFKIGAQIRTLVGCPTQEVGYLIAC